MLIDTSRPNYTSLCAYATDHYLTNVYYFATLMPYYAEISFLPNQSYIQCFRKFT